MANTTIALRSSGTAAATPSLGVLANGELSINYADGIIYYKTASNTLGSIRTTQPAGLTTEIQFNDAGSFGSNSGLTFSKSTGYFKAPIIESTNNGQGTNFKVGDDIWLGDINQADTLGLRGQQNSANAYIVFGSSDNSKLGRSGTGALTYTGNFVATGELSTLFSSGDEGGQINFGIPQTNTTLSNGVVIDVYQNRLRFWESGGTNRGAYIDLTAAGVGVGTNLLTGGGAVTSVAGATGAVSNNQILAGLLTVDGAGSGLDADLLDGLSSASFANAAFANTDYTTISATAGVYGNASHVPVTTLTANGRVSLITNTAIAIDAAAITSGTLAVARGGTGVTTSTGTGAVVLNTAPTITLPTVNNIRQGYSTTVTAAGTTTLTVNSNYLQFFTGTTTQILSLPAPQTMTLGMGFFVVNNSTGNIEVRASNSAAVATILAGTAMLFVSIDLTAGNGAAGWSAEIVGFSTLTGTGAVVLNTSPTLSTPTVNRVDWPSTGYAPPSFTTRSTGTKLNLYPALSGSLVDYAIGIDGATLWSSVPAATNAYYFKWYGGESNIASLDGTGRLTVVTANIVSTNTSTSNTTGALTVMGGIGAKGNVSVDGVIFPDGTRQTTAATGGASIGDVLALSIALG